MPSRFYRLCETLSRLLLLAGGVLIALSVPMVAIEVIVRKIFGLSLFPGTDEISGYVFASAVTWSLSYALYRRRHIRIDALYIYFPAGVRHVLDIAALLGLAGFFSLLTYQAAFVVAESIRIGAESNTVLRVPLWLPQSAWLFGLVFFVFNIFVILAETLAGLRRGDYELVQRIAAAPSIRDEIQDEVDDARASAEKALSLDRTPS